VRHHAAAYEENPKAVLGTVLDAGTGARDRGRRGAGLDGRIVAVIQGFVSSTWLLRRKRGAVTTAERSPSPCPLACGLSSLHFGASRLGAGAFLALFGLTTARR